MRPRRPPKPVTPASLEAAALFYLGRFAATRETLRRVLMRRVVRAARAGVSDAVEAERWVAALVERLARSGAVDDDVYAAGRARSLLRQGRPRRVIARALAAKGVEAESADAAIAALDEVGPQPDLIAAIAYARRRRLGPFRPEDRAANRLRDLAAMGRAGFSGTVARQVIDAADRDALEQLQARESA